MQRHSFTSPNPSGVIPLVTIRALRQTAYQLTACLLLALCLVWLAVLAPSVAHSADPLISEIRSADLVAHGASDEGALAGLSE